MKQATLSFAVMALLGLTEAAHHHHHHHHAPSRRSQLQFIDEVDEEAETAQSIAESEKEHGAKMQVLDEDHMKQALRQDNKLKFNGDEFQKNDRVENSLHRNLLLGTGFINMDVPTSYPGVTMISSAAQLKSDPIHGSLGPPPVDPDHLFPEQRFEYEQRQKVPQNPGLDAEVAHTADSIKAAEKITGDKMKVPSLEPPKLPEVKPWVPPKEKEGEDDELPTAAQYQRPSRRLIDILRDDASGKLVSVAQRRRIPGVTMISSAAQLKSDPIHGSLGPPVVNINDLGPEAAFEESQRRMPPPVYTDDEDVTTTANSIKKAEGITGGSMEEPYDPLVQAKIAPTVAYKLHGSDDEEDDTVETRRSVKTAEKYFGKRFFINKKEKEDYEKGLANGSLDPRVATFQEPADVSITANAAEETAKEKAKKAETEAAAAAAKKAAADPEGAKEAAAAEAAAADQAAALDLPPELNPDFAPPALMQRKAMPYKKSYLNHQFADIN